MIDLTKELRYGKYGTNAVDIYDKCCNSFGWKKVERNNFFQQQSLYAKDVADNKLSVWFIANSDWTKFDPKHKNVLGLFADPITEEYMQGEKPSEIDKTNRIVFAKKKDGNYYFLGVYEVLEQNDKIRIYQQISNIYPFEK